MSKVHAATYFVLSVQALQLLSVCSGRHSDLPAPWKPHERIPRSDVDNNCSLTLYQHSNREGQQLVLTTDDSNLANNGIWNDEASSIRVTGPCQWILYSDGNYAEFSSSSIVGPGTTDYEFGNGINGFRLPNDDVSSVRCLPANGTRNMVLFQHDRYRGRMIVLSSSNPDLADVSFDDDVTSLVITGGTWQLYSRFNYQGFNVTLGRGNYPTATSLGPIGNDGLTSVRLLAVCAPGCNETGGYCQNDGECLCRTGWTGTSCGTCSPSSGCSSVGGYCNNPYECICYTGFGGGNCDINLYPCQNQSLCQNGATCVDDVAGVHMCVCPPGYMGASCQTEIDECSPSPCLNGASCTDLVNGYQCNCAEGWMGTNCDGNINDCSPNTCQNGGFCYDLVADYSCGCIPGWTGASCQTNIDDCVSDPCMNGGTCTDLIGYYICHCSPGFYGRNCETDQDECASNPCNNGANCIDVVSGYKCECALGWTGTNCDVNINDCAPSSCLNGGFCHDLIANYNCTCLPWWTGYNCQTNINECTATPCMNGGTCIDVVGSPGYQCACVRGWTGGDCTLSTGEGTQSNAGLIGGLIAAFGIVVIILITILLVVVLLLTKSKWKTKMFTTNLPHDSVPSTLPKYSLNDSTYLGSPTGLVREGGGTSTLTQDPQVLNPLYEVEKDDGLGPSALDTKTPPAADSYNMRNTFENPYAT